MTNLDAIYSQLQKLQALADNPGASEHEAARAAEHIQRLLDKHNLDRASIGAAATVDEVLTQSVKIQKDTTRFQMPAWELDLAGIVADAYYCKIIRTSKKAQGLYFYVFIGTSVDLSVCTSVFIQLRNKVLGLAPIRVKEYSEKCYRQGYDVRMLQGEHSLRAFRNSWYLGVVQGIKSALASSQRQSNNAIMALVVVKDAANQAVQDQLFPRAKSARVVSAVFNTSALRQGIEDGKAMHTHKELSNGQK